jgi:hypothetical protein
LTVWLDDPSAYDADAFPRELAGHPLWLTAFNQAGRYLSDNGMMTDEQANSPVDFGITLAPDGEAAVVGGSRVRKIRLAGRATAVTLPVECPRVEAYGPPSATRPDAIVERLALGETSIVHDGDRLAIIVDISAIELPPLCQFKGLKTSGGSVRQTIESLELFGAERLPIARGRITVEVHPVIDDSSA